MIREKKQVVTVKKEATVAEEMYCDVCGKLIRESHMDENGYKSIYAPGPERGYWDCSTMHHNWVNDSCDSIENADICSDECLRKWMDKYLNGDDYEMREFTIKHERF